MVVFVAPPPFIIVLLLLVECWNAAHICSMALFGEKYKKGLQQRWCCCCWWFAFFLWSGATACLLFAPIYVCMHVHVYPVCICLSLFTHATGGKCCTQSAFSCCSPPTSLPASLMLYTLCGCTLYFYHYFWLFLLSLFGCEICCCLPFSI